MVAYRAYKEVVIYVIEVTEFNFDIRCGLRGHMEAATASEATKMAVPGNMHMDARVINVACIKSEALRLFGGHHVLRGHQKDYFRQTTTDTTIIEVV